MTRQKQMRMTPPITPMKNDNYALSEYRTIVDALDGNLDESMFLESQEDAVAYTE